MKEFSSDNEWKGELADICDYLGSLVKYMHTHEHVMYILINVFTEWMMVVGEWSSYFWHIPSFYV